MTENGAIGTAERMVVTPARDRLPSGLKGVKRDKVVRYPPAPATFGAAAGREPLRLAIPFVDSNAEPRTLLSKHEEQRNAVNFQQYL
jgi:hypothetical protein